MTGGPQHTDRVRVIRVSGEVPDAVMRGLANIAAAYAAVGFAVELDVSGVGVVDAAATDALAALSADVARSGLDLSIIAGPPPTRSSKRQGGTPRLAA